MKIKCISGYSYNGVSGILQVFYDNNLEAKYARLRIYKGINLNSKKPMFDYLKISIDSEIQALLMKQLEQSANGQAKTKLNIEQSSKIPSLNQNSSGCSLAWFRTSACHVDDPGSNPGNRTTQLSNQSWRPRIA